MEFARRNGIMQEFTFPCTRAMQDKTMGNCVKNHPTNKQSHKKQNDKECEGFY